MENTKTKMYNLSIRVMYCVFVLLTLIFFCLPVIRYFGESVYRCASHGNYMDGVDSRWETSYIVVEIFANIFADIDLIYTPCALLLMLSCISVLFALSVLLVRLIAGKKVKRISLKADIILLVSYLIYIILSVIIILGVKRWNGSEFIGPAPIVIIIFSSLFFIASVALYVKRKKYFAAQPQLTVED